MRKRTAVTLIAISLAVGLLAGAKISSHIMGKIVSDGVARPPKTVVLEMLVLSGMKVPLGRPICASKTQPCQRHSLTFRSTVFRPVSIATCCLIRGAVLTT